MLSTKYVSKLLNNIKELDMFDLLICFVTVLVIFAFGLIIL